MVDNFKIIAIRPLSKCDKNLLRVLSTNKVYQLYNNYTFNYQYGDERLDVIGVEKDKDPVQELYKINRGYGNGLSVSISAIVGENGSGKSSIIELFFASL
jgi:ABC-type polysaccharide/polyol phosphate transport system ATPase subunit